MPGIYDRLWRVIAPPRFADPETDRIARAVYTCAIAFLVVNTGWTISSLVIGRQSELVLAIGSAATATFAMMALLARRGFARTSSVLLVAQIYLAGTYGVWYEGGVPITSMGTFLVATMAASVFFSAWIAWATAALSISTLLGFWRLRHMGLLPEGNELAEASIFVSGFTMLALIVPLIQLNLARIRESQRLLREVTDSTPHALFLFDVIENEGSYANRSARALLAEGDRDRMDLTSLAEFVHPDDRGRLAEHLVRAAEASDDEILDVEFRAHGHDRTWRVLRTQTRVFDRTPDGRVRQILGLTEDVTAEREAARALEQSREQLRRAERLEALGQLAGGIAHDFNNYLTVIIGATDAAAREVGGDEVLLRELIDEARDAALHSADLTRQLLGFSRHRLTQPRTFQLNDLLRDSDRLLRRVIPANIEIDMLTADGLPPIHADPGQIEQVVLNLAVNARDAMPEGGRVTLSTARVSVDAAAARRSPDAREGEYVLLSVADTGSGMDEEIRGQIFEPLFTTKGSGTGFGLATVDAIVRQSGGHLEVESEPGSGTCFKVYLPCTEGEPSALGEAREGAYGGGDEHVMLVEDDPMVRNLTRRILESAGYRVTAFADGPEARHAFLEQPDVYDLLLTDIMMPGLSGLDLAASLRETREALPVVFMSGYTANVSAERGLGPKDNLLHKPFTSAELQLRIREALDRR